MGVLKAGGAYVPLDPDYPPEHMAFMIEDAGVSVLLDAARLGRSSCRRRKKNQPIESIWTTGTPQLSRRQSRSPRPPENLAYVIYTSGSTGRPKGVCISSSRAGQLPVMALARPDTCRARRRRAAVRVVRVSTFRFQEAFSDLAVQRANFGLDLRRAAARCPTPCWRSCMNRRFERLFLPFVALQHLAEEARWL